MKKDSGQKATKNVKKDRGQKATKNDRRGFESRAVRNQSAKLRRRLKAGSHSRNVKTLDGRCAMSPYKKCSCGLVFEARKDWETYAKRLKIYEGDDGSLKQQGNCPQCQSTLVVTLVEAMSIGELRQAMALIDSLMKYTAQEFLRLARRARRHQ